eukprot:571387_1
MARIVLSSMMVLFAATALSLGYIGTLWCCYVEFTDRTETYKEQLGIWRYMSDSCQEYPTNFDTDAAWNVARAFSIVAAVSGSTLFVISVIVAFRTFTNKTVHT